MTPEQQRTAIAIGAGVVPQGWFGIIGPDGNDIPDYLSDLNAMHEAVESLPIGKRTEWPMRLREIVARDNKGQENPDTGLLDDTHFYNATAAQRAEAFLKTIGKWQ